MTTTTKQKQQEAAADVVVLLKLDDILPNPNQPRQHFNEEELHELAESIKADGLKVPIWVRDLHNGKYEIVDGERRYRAHKLLGYPEIKAIIDETVQSQKEATKQSLIMNIQRSDVPPQDKEVAIYKLCQPAEEGGGGMSTREVAAILGKSHGAIDNVIRAYKSRQTLLQRVPTIVGTISTAALNLTSFIKDENIRIGILKMISEGRMKLDYKTIKETANLLKQVTRAVQEEYFAGNLSLLQMQDLVRQDEYNLILSDPFAVIEEEVNEKEIILMGMNAPIAQNALLFMWVPGKKLVQGLDVMREWGFQYVTEACWIDDKERLDKDQLKKNSRYDIMEDPNVQYYKDTYSLFIGRKGVGLGVPPEANRPPSVLNYAKCCEGLTEKMDVAHAAIELMYPAYAYKYLEVLTPAPPKNSIHKDGWKRWNGRRERK